jgi:hypothetical protein
MRRPMVVHRLWMVAFRSLAKAFSMGLKSGLLGGR